MLAKMNKEDDYTKYLSDIDEYITECYRTDEQLDRIKATEWQRIALAVAAAGGDPEAIGSDRSGNPVNLMADGVYNWRHTKSIDMQGCNGIIYGLIALDSISCRVPEKAVYTRDRLVNMLLDYQSGDGSFSLSREGSGDTDITAMALQALAPYATDGTPASELKAETKAKAESAAGKALKYLASELGDNGMYAYDDEYSSETSSQVIMALCAMGIDPKESGDFTKDGVSIVDGMMNFRMDNGGFSHSEAANADESGDNIMSSQQAGCAFVSLMLMQNGEGGFFDFADR